MDRIGILQLNDYCLDNILQFLDIKEQICFAQTCSRFRDIFFDWSRRENTKVSILGDVEPWELTFLSLNTKSVKELKLFVDDLVDSIIIYDSYTKNNQVVVKFCNLVRSMNSLECIKIWQVTPHPITKLLLRALRDLPNLKQLYVGIPKRVNFGKFHRLELISIDVKMPPRVLLRYCRSLTKLRTLHLSDQVSSSNLRDIVEHLPALQELSFYIDRSTRSRITACHKKQINSLIMVLDFLASKRTLKVLRIKGHIIAQDEAESLTKIQSLQSLDCSFAYPELVKYLSLLTSLQILRITYLHPIDISSIYLDVIRQCKDLLFLRLYDFNINPDFLGRASKVLKDIESKNKLQLLIYGRHNSLTLREFRSKALDTNNLLFRSISATELLKIL
ncbi:uncharacterized protein LOC108041232 [Drosophila rhopaloa]|uniref:F-box domain-containing protein n=1 Tax=Drosophila rhopaloa TaxID=1041015 RepID=A0ABM5H4Z1_DRORH|nr:uncharacterized protein LOC108041232 [Drosophila rhopaloa]